MLHSRGLVCLALVGKPHPAITSAAPAPGAHLLRATNAWRMPSMLPRPCPPMLSSPAPESLSPPAGLRTHARKCRPKGL